MVERDTVVVDTSRWPVSVKGVVGPPGHVVLLHNERDEWELPGGRLDPEDASLEAALVREFDEELGLDVTVEGPAVDAWLYEPIPGRHVVVITFGCGLVGAWPDRLQHSHEHDDVGVFALDQLAGLQLPDGYRRAIAAATAADNVTD